jgi:hypothetical protein
MTQSDAADAANGMADAYARTGNTDDHSRVHQTAWNGAFEFIPDDAPWAVVEGEDGPPKLVALDGQKLYTMTVGDLGEESLSATARCRLILIDATEATVEFTTKFSGIRNGPEPMSRETTWSFNLGGGEKLTFSTKFSAGQSRMRPDELLAQQLAEALGWTGLPQARPAAALA